MRVLRSIGAITAFLASFPAAAGCGTAFCSLNTDWHTQGAWTEPGGRLDLRYEYIDQDQPRAGSRDVAVGEIPKHHDEVRTINRNLITTFDYTIDANWGFAVTAPAVSRDHSHIHHHHGALLDETWDFTRLGDARVTGRYSFPGTVDSPHPGNSGMVFGLKLPTGEYDVANANGDVAERSLQPGTGTTDAILGAFHANTLANGSSWFADANVLAALDDREGYKPGTRVGVDIGVSYPWTSRLALLLQVNAHWKDRDSGSSAEPEDTGGTFVHLSPGVGVSIGDKTRLYGFVQLPLYQYVNGVQLTADWSVAAGVSRRF